MVGAVDVAIAGQAATMLFLNDHVVFRIATYRSALTMLNFSFPAAETIGKLLSFNEIILKAQVGKRDPIELFPQPNWIVRWLSPAVREIVRAAKS